MMNTEMKNAIREIKNNNETFDFIDCMIEKFEDYVEENGKSSDFLNKLEDADERFLLIRLFGNYHYQVNNGGHYQYFDNGYCSTDDIDHGCFGNKSEELDLHKTMIALFKKYLPMNDTTTKFIKILEEFNNCVDYATCESCDGTGYVEDECECEHCNGTGYLEEDGEEVECFECNGTGSITEESECWDCHGTGVSNYLTVIDSNDLDKRYYNIEKDVLDIVNNMIENWINSDEDCIMNSFEDSDYNHAKQPSKYVLKLVGTDGNAFAILGKVKEALRVNHVASEIIEKFMKEATSGNYDNLLCTCMKYCADANIEVR